MTTLRIGTRGSALALWQARHVADLLRARDESLDIEECILRTEGDANQDVSIARVGQGVFVRRIERALLEGEIDLAVHSLKDLPSTDTEGLTIGAVPARHDPRDAVVSLDGGCIETLAEGTLVGTGSPRRRCQLLHARPDLDFRPIRGNVDTRVRKVRDGEVGAIVLAVAGLERLGVEGVGIRPIAPSVCLPAVGQGALAIQVRDGDQPVARRVEPLGHRLSRIQIDAERSFLARLGAGCLAPATAHARTGDGRVFLEAVVGDLDGTGLLLDRESGPEAEAAAIGARLAERLLVAGAERILDGLRRDHVPD